MAGRRHGTGRSGPRTPRCSGQRTGIPNARPIIADGGRWLFEIGIDGDRPGRHRIDGWVSGRRIPLAGAIMRIDADQRVDSVPSDGSFAAPPGTAALSRSV
jgi:hypothetical protein